MSSVEHVDDRCSAVRFEPQCVVIPDPAHRSRLPRVVTKSYTLPLWKRRTPPSPCVSEPDENQLVLRVPLPTLSLKPASTRAVDHGPLPPCLVHRPDATSFVCSSPPLQYRHRTSRKHSPSPSRSDVVTVPLRPCCAACEAVTEAALNNGDAWPERFSRAASRQRSRSIDGSLRTITVAGSAASASYGALGVSINVDEVDKRRRASDVGPSKPSQDLWSSIDRIPPEPTRVTPATPRIPEEDDEDENELFPLPSPKRTPTASPAPSPGGSLSSLMVASVHGAGASPTPSSCSGDCVPPKRHLLVPPPCSLSSSSLSLPKLSEPTSDVRVPDDPPQRAPSPSVLATLPSLSGRPRSPLPVLSYPTEGRVAIDDHVSGADVLDPASVPGCMPTPPSSWRGPSTLQHSPTQTRFSWRSRRSVSVDGLSPSSSPTLSTISAGNGNNRKPFSISSSLHVFADVIRGVGAIGSSGTTSAGFMPGM